MASETYIEFDCGDDEFATARFLIRTVDIWKTESTELTLINFKEILLALLLLSNIHLAIGFVAFHCMQMFFINIFLWIEDTMTIMDLEYNLTNLEENMLEMVEMQKMQKMVEELKIMFKETTTTEKASPDSYNILESAIPAFCILLFLIVYLLHKKKLDIKVENIITQLKEDAPKQNQTCYDEVMGEGQDVEDQLEDKKEALPLSEDIDPSNFKYFQNQKKIETEENLTNLVADVITRNTYRTVKSETMRKDSPMCCEMKVTGKIIELQCTTNCHFSIHLRCTDKLQKVDPKKSLTGKPCLTPDCWGVVTTISWKYQNGKVYKTEKMEVPNIKRNIVSDGVKQPIKMVKPPLKPNVSNIQKDISSSNQTADVRHLVADSSAINKSLKNEEPFTSSKQRRGPTKRSKTKKTLNIELNPIIQRRCEEFVRKEIVLKLILQKSFLEEKTAKTLIAAFVNEKGLVLRKDIPIIVEGVKADFESEQKAIEEDIIEKTNEEVKEVDDADEDVCPICLDAIAENEMEVLDCAHEYHKSCISEWMTHNRACPECRAYIKLLQEFPPIVRAVEGS